MRLSGSAALISLLTFIGPQAAKATILSSWTWDSTINVGALSAPVYKPVAGSAVFSVVSDGAGWDLVIDLSNTEAVAPTTTALLLTGLYFDIGPGGGALTMSTATATGGLLTATNQTGAVSGTVGANICAPGAGGTAPNPSCATTIAGGWEAAYSAIGLNSGTYAEHWGIGASGQSGTFNGNNTTGTGSGNYAIAPGNGVGDGSGGGGVSNMLPYVYGNASFILTGLSTNLITISNVSGAYGTAPEGTPAAVTSTGVPEPSSLAVLAACGLAMVGFRRNMDGAARQDS